MKGGTFCPIWNADQVLETRLGFPMYLQGQLSCNIHVVMLAGASALC